MSTARILVIPGSSRTGSLNHKLALTVADHLPAQLHIDVLAPEHVQLPLYCQDLETDAQHRALLGSLHARFAAAHGFIVASPEHNGCVSAYLKNLVDWVSRLARLDPAAANPFLHKPLLLATATTSWKGGVLGLQVARSLFAYLGCLVLPETLILADAGNAWDDEDLLMDLQLLQRIPLAVAPLLQLVPGARDGTP